MRRSVLFTAFILAGAALVPARAQDADDLKRGVARISILNGDVTVRRGDTGDWVAAAANAPLMTQDHIATGPASRAEVQLDYANFLRLGANGEVVMAQLESGRYQLQLAHGTATFRVLRDYKSEVELDTPTISVRPTKQGIYRITVRDDGETEVTVRAGDAEIFSPRGSQHLRAGQSLMARGTASDPEFQVIAAIGYDDWDGWNESRDRALQNTTAYKYVSPDVYGAEDLDGHGTWVNDTDYGYVWQPTVSPGWAPYQVGRWVWTDWYGWTWVSGDPWGWAPYHYGRWYYGGNAWRWYPGGHGGRHYWSPALVGFFGFGGVGVGFGWGNVGWVPLAPYEHYDHWWGRGYYGGYRGGNYNNVHINNNVNITNVYRNARGHNGVSSVSSSDFSSGRFGNINRVNESQLRQASVSRGQVPMAPSNSHLQFSDRQVQNVPRSQGNTQFYSRRQAGSVDRVPFRQQQDSLSRVSQVPVSRASVAGVAANPVGRNEAGRLNSNGGQSTQPNGWRRANEPASAGSAPAAQGQVQRNNSGSSDRGGWRRFGEPSGAGAATQPSQGAAPAARNDSQTRNNGGSSDRGGWRRFGEPSTAQPSAGTAAPARTETQPQRNNGSSADRGGWRKFGDPGTSVQPQPRQDSQRNADRPSNPNQDRQRVGGSSGNTPRQQPDNAPRQNRQQQEFRQSSPSQDSPRYGSPRQQESIHIAPPVVRERSAPRTERPSGSNGGGGSRMYSAPSGGGGGNRGASAPSGGGGGNRSASAPSGGGGSSRGASAPSGGGHSGGGHGGRNR